MVFECQMSEHISFFHLLLLDMVKTYIRHSEHKILGSISSITYAAVVYCGLISSVEVN